MGSLALLNNGATNKQVNDAARQVVIDHGSSGVLSSAAFIVVTLGSSPDPHNRRPVRTAGLRRMDRW